MRLKKTITRSPLPLKTISQFHEFYTQHPNWASPYPKIDDTTWNDLHMNALFAKLSTCFTTAGKHWLYDALRQPEFDMGPLDQRIHSIQSLEKLIRDEPQKANQLSQYLRKIGHTEYNCLQVMSQKIQANTRLLLVLLFLRTLLFVSIIGTTANFTMVTAFNSSLWLPFAMIMFSINTVLSLLLNASLKVNCEVLSYMMAIISRLKKINAITTSLLPDWSKETKTLYTSLKPLVRKGSGVTFLEGVDAVKDYINTLTFLKPIAYLKSAKFLSKRVHEVQRLYTLFGELDAHFALAQHRIDGSDHPTKPITYSRVHPKTTPISFYIHAENLYHPLIDDPKGNSILMDQSILLTGSNMSGKSTFLRTLAINAVCAQTLGLSFSSHYEAVPLHVISCISIGDDLSEGKSYYFAEAQALLRMVQTPPNDDFTPFFVIDEIFKGTNPLERISAATILLNELAAKGSLVAVSTHDQNLCYQVEGYDAYYFTEQVTSTSLDFDYKLRPGYDYQKNAIKILDYLGFPKVLTEQMLELVRGCEGP